MAVWQYNPSDVTFTIAGFISVEGYAADTFITITKDVQPFTYTESADGVVSRTYRKSGTYTVELELAQSSISNSYIALLRQADESTMSAKFPIFIKDSSGDTLLFSPTAWIENEPDSIFANELNTRTWMFKAANCVATVGGNDDRFGIEDIGQVIAQAYPLAKQLGGLF